ncbi:MAG TPA: MFS transporter [Kofleriaceae bacterium]|nr:MFS transporter [Kofleriaceae bacterium]
MRGTRSTEARLVGWGAAAFALVLASYAAFRPVRDALILDGDPDQIPWLFTATFVAVAIVSPLWSALVGHRARRRALVGAALHVFAACEVLFFVLVRERVAPVTVGRVFYVWSAVFNLFAVSVFWSLCADLLGPSAARRLYGPIAAGGTAGTVLGPLLTKLFVDDLGVDGILLLSAVMLELAVIAIAGMRRAANGSIEPEEPAPERSGALDGIRHVARSPYLAAIVGYVLCTATAATFMYLAQAKITHDALPGHEARADFFATLDLWTAGVTAVLQTLVARPALGRFGPGVVLMILPLSQAIGISSLVVAPSLATLAIAQVASRSATHGLTRPAREMLFTVVSRDDKYRAKNAIDTVAYRLGDFGSSWLYKGLVAAGAGGGAVIAASAPLVAIWLALAFVLGAGFRRRSHQQGETS